MDKVAGHRPPRAKLRSLDEWKTLARAQAGGRFRFHRTRKGLTPQIVLSDPPEDRVRRMTRLHQSYQLMTSLVRMVWPADVRLPRDPGAVSWRGAVESLTEGDEQLTVVWRDEDHLEKYRLVAELAWAGLCESARPVIHRNGDPHGLQQKPEEDALW
jgi:hypothetical protein